MIVKTLWVLSLQAITVIFFSVDIIFASYYSNFFIFSLYSRKTDRQYQEVSLESPLSYLININNI